MLYLRRLDAPDFASFLHHLPANICQNMPENASLTTIQLIENEKEKSRKTLILRGFPGSSTRATGGIRIRDLVITNDAL